MDDGGERGTCLKVKVAAADESGVDVGHDTTLTDVAARGQLVELLVVANGQHDVARDDTGLLIITRGISGQLEDLGKEKRGEKKKV